MEKLSRRAIVAAVEDRRWDFANGLLYDLCSKHLSHVRVDVIIAKVWLIGRSYAAAIERGRCERTANDLFYESQIGPRIARNEIDTWLAPLKQAVRDADMSIAVHKRLVDLFHSLTGRDHRSLASKYLCFHFPDHFFIYDTRAVAAVARFTERTVRRTYDFDVDLPYASHFRRCEALASRIEEGFDMRLTPREVDKVLLAS